MLKDKIEIDKYYLVEYSTNYGNGTFYNIVNIIGYSNNKKFVLFTLGMSSPEAPRNVEIMPIDDFNTKYEIKDMVEGIEEACKGRSLVTIHI